MSIGDRLFIAGEFRWNILGIRHLRTMPDTIKLPAVKGAGNAFADHFAAIPQMAPKCGQKASLLNPGVEDRIPKDFRFMPDCNLAVPGKDSEKANSKHLCIMYGKRLQAEGHWITSVYYRLGTAHNRFFGFLGLVEHPIAFCEQVGQYVVCDFIWRGNFYTFTSRLHHSFKVIGGFNTHVAGAVRDGQILRAYSLRIENPCSNDVRTREKRGNFNWRI